MALRKIIKIDEVKCNGCGLCVPNCAEGAIQIIDGKARLVKDSYCDGLGACLGHCPQDALKVIEREAEEFDEEEAIKFVASLKKESVPSSSHASQPVHSPAGHHSGGCPGSRVMAFRENAGNSAKTAVENGDIEVKIKPQLRQWPVQLNLVSVSAPYFENADLLVTADCVPFAYANYHLDLLKGKVVVVGCPKLDDNKHYTEKLTDIFRRNNIKSVTVAHMEVPCCSGILRAVSVALQQAGKDISLTKVRISIAGEAERW